MTRALQPHFSCCACPVGWARFHESWKSKIPQPDYFHYRSSEYGKTFFSARARPPGVPMASKVYVVGYSSKIVKFEAVFYFPYFQSTKIDLCPKCYWYGPQKVTQQSLKPSSLIWQFQVTSDFM